MTDQRDALPPWLRGPDAFNWYHTLITVAAAIALGPTALVAGGLLGDRWSAAGWWAMYLCVGLVALDTVIATRIGRTRLGIHRTAHQRALQRRQAALLDAVAALADEPTFHTIGATECLEQFLDVVDSGATVAALELPPDAKEVVESLLNEVWVAHRPSTDEGASYSDAPQPMGKVSALAGQALATLVRQDQPSSGQAP